MSALFEEFDDIADLAEGLDDPSAGARIMAVIDLADSADPAAIPYLARAIADPDAGVRKQAAQARSELAPARKEMQEAEVQIERLNAQIRKIDVKLQDPKIYNGPPAKIAELSKLKALAQQAVEDAELRWMEAAERLESA